MSAKLLDEIMALEADERRQLGELLLQSVDEPEIAPEILDEMERRLEEHYATPESSIPWEDVRARLHAR